MDSVTLEDVCLSLGLVAEPVVEVGQEVFAARFKLHVYQSLDQSSFLGLVAIFIIVELFLLIFLSRGLGLLALVRMSLVEI